MENKEWKTLSEGALIDEIEVLQHHWISEGIREVQKKFGMDHGDCSPGLDMEFKEVFGALAKCTYKQLKENGYLSDRQTTKDEWLIFNATDGVMAHPEAMKESEIEPFIRAFRNRFNRQGYYLTSRGFRIAPADIKLKAQRRK